MARVGAEVPDLIFKPNIMPTQWSLKIKVMTALVLLLVYIYLILFIKMLYLKNKRLDGIMAMADETQQLITSLHAADDRLARQLEEAAEY